MVKQAKVSVVFFLGSLSNICPTTYCIFSAHNPQPVIVTVSFLGSIMYIYVMSVTRGKILFSNDKYCPLSL